MPFSKDLHFLEHWLAPVVEESEAHIGETWAYANKYLLLVVAIAIATIGIALAYVVYVRRRMPALEPRILEQAWLYDSAVAKVVAGPGSRSFEAVAWFDANVVDGAVRGTAGVVQGFAGAARRLQNGFVRAYAGLIALGALLVLAWFIVRGLW